MAITIGGASFPNLTAQPYQYSTSGTEQGLTARSWALEGLLSPSEWLSLLAVYDAWRDLKILEDPPEDTGVVGATVLFSGTGAGGAVWTDIPCWFQDPPSASQQGALLSVGLTVVDAAQRLEVILKTQEEQSESSEDRPDFGTLTISNTTLELRKPLNAFRHNTSTELTASQKHFVSGALVAEEIYDVEGATNLAGYTDINSWYATIMTSVPLPGSYYPISEPEWSAENEIVAGVKTAVYTLQIELIKII